jgi:hypothetical protein
MSGRKNVDKGLVNSGCKEGFSSSVKKRVSVRSFKVSWTNDKVTCHLHIFENFKWEGL